MRKPFYGWIIVGVTFLIGVTESGAFQNILAIFMKPMAQEFGWSRAVVTGSIAVGSLFAGLISPLVGPILDRHGPRLVAFWGIVILSAGLIGMRFVNSIWQFYLFFGVGRMVAMGVLSMVISVSVSNWFIRQRGRALGVTWLGPQFGAAMMPALTQFFIMSLGWRLAWSTLGTVVFLLSGLPALILLRRRPEDMGLLPDGDTAPPGEKKSGKPSSQRDGNNPAGVGAEQLWSRSQAVRTLSFWVLTCVDAMVAFQNAGVNFHVFPFLTDRGIPALTAVLVLSTIAVFAAVGSVMWGYLVERAKAQTLLAANFFGNCLVFLLLYWSVRYRLVEALGVWTVFALGALHGMLYGGRQPMVTFVWAKFFGRKSLGSIYSFSTPFRYAANAVSPIFAAFCFDAFGSYAFPFYFFAATYFVACTLSLYLKSPGAPAQVPGK
ncbi:MAG: MFS transporter [Thermodesulfobacteriota bacterium]